MIFGRKPPRIYVKTIDFAEDGHRPHGVMFGGFDTAPGQVGHHKNLAITANGDPKASIDGGLYYRNGELPGSDSMIGFMGNLTGTRYPDSVDVIVPACTYESAMLSPSGRLLSVREKNAESNSIYLLDLQTGEKTPSPVPENSSFYFLTDELLYVSVGNGMQEYVLDRTNGNQYPIQEFRTLFPNAYIGKDANLELLAQALKQARYVFYRAYDGSIIALDPDFPDSGANNFTINQFGIPGDDRYHVEQFLIENNIIYQTILPDFPEQVTSQDGRFVARPDGIYLVKTGQKILEGYSASRSFRGYSRKYFFARGWTYDGKAVIASKFLNPCLIETTFFISDDYSCYFEVTQPVLKIKVPEQYLSPNGIQ